MLLYLFLADLSWSVIVEVVLQWQEAALPCLARPPVTVAAGGVVDQSLRSIFPLPLLLSSSGGSTESQVKRGLTNAHEIAFTYLLCTICSDVLCLLSDCGRGDENRHYSLFLSHFSPPHNVTIDVFYIIIFMEWVTENPSYSNVLLRGIFYMTGSLTWE